MAKDSNIGWTHHTVNFWWGCVELSPACVNCYAKTYDAMRGPNFDHGLTHWGENAPRWMKVESALLELRRHDAAARKLGVRHRVFINSMSDFFEDRPDLEGARLLALAAFAQCTNLDILLLTKRALIAVEWFQDALHNYSTGITCSKALDRIWMGFTGENQFWFDERWEHIGCIPAAKVFCSYEPACGPLVLPDSFLARGREAWLIVGGESGPHRREVGSGLAGTCRRSVRRGWRARVRQTGLRSLPWPARPHPRRDLGAQRLSRR